MKELMHNIKNLTDKTINAYEIEHITDTPEYIDIRLYNEDTTAAKQVTRIINERLNNQIIKADIYTPHQDIVKYGYSGIPFTGIEIKVNPATVTLLNEDYLLMDENAPE